MDTIHEIISLQFTDIQKSVDSTESLKIQDRVYASTNSVVKLQTLTTMDSKDSKETSIKVQPDAARITDTLKNPRSLRARSGRSPLILYRTK